MAERTLKARLGLPLDAPLESDSSSGDGIELRASESGNSYIATTKRKILNARNITIRNEDVFLVGGKIDIDHISNTCYLYSASAFATANVVTSRSDTPRIEIYAQTTTIDGTEHRLLKYLLKPTADIKDADIGHAIGLFSELLAQTKFRVVDDIFEAIDADKISIEMMIVLLRTSFSARSSLRQWRAFYSRAIETLSSRGRDPTVVLRGLSPPA
jgi:hypothetical protein